MPTPIDFSVSKGAKAQLELGLRWHEEGHSGDGLLPSTVAEARRLIRTGKWWPSKVKLLLSTRRPSRAYVRRQGAPDAEGCRVGAVGR